MRTAVGDVKIFVIVRNHENGFPARLQFGQQLGVKHVLEIWVLVCRPLVKDVNRAVLQIRSEQSQTLALAL
jgi:hypothetical protein